MIKPGLIIVYSHDCIVNISQIQYSSGDNTFFEEAKEIILKNQTKLL